MLNEVRRLLKLFSIFGFDGIILASVEKGEIELKTLVGCIVLMHYYLHTSMHITAMTMEMIRRYPAAINKKGLKVSNETNIQYDLLVVTAVSKKMGQVIELKIASDLELMEVVN